MEWRLAACSIPAVGVCLERGATVYDARALRPDLALCNLASGVYGDCHRFVTFHRLCGNAVWRRNDIPHLSVAQAFQLGLNLVTHVSNRGSRFSPDCTVRARARICAGLSKSGKV